MKANVGILENIVGGLGTRQDGEELRLQYEAQSDVVCQLGKRVEQQLASQLKGR